VRQKFNLESSTVQFNWFVAFRDVRGW